MAITSAGIGSGLNIESLVSQLMSLERRPLAALKSRENDFQGQLSAYGRLQGAMSAFQNAMKGLSTPEKFKIFTNTSSDASVLTASSDSSAAAGVYAVNVDRLAQNHKLGSDEFADTDAFGGAADDSLTLTVDGSAITVDLSAAKTLTEIRDAVNADSANPGVTATILNTGAGKQRLILTADDSGYDKRVELTYGGTITASTLNLATLNTDSAGAKLTDLTQLDAAYSVDSIALTSASNSISGVIEGVTLNLHKTGAADLTLARDTDKITASAKAFVSAYNTLHGTFRGMSEGVLAGDSTIRSIQGQLRSVINTPPAGMSSTTFNGLGDVGITTDPKTGELVFDAVDFKKALEADMDGVSELFSLDGEGYAFRLDAMAGSILDKGSLVDTREDGLNSRIKRLQDDQTKMESRLVLREKALRSQFAALDGLIGSLNNTSNFLLQQLTPQA